MTDSTKDTPVTAPADDTSLARASALAHAAGLELVRDEGGLALTDGTMAVRADLVRMLRRLRPKNLSQELLVRAAKLRHEPGITLTAVDATAGLGDDSALLAAAGFEVMLFERDPVMAALLADALARARKVPELCEVAGRMRLVEGDSVTALLAMAKAGEHPDVVLLDPMFPERRKSASVKKKLQLLQRLERPCEDERALLDAALAASPRKVVIKRPPKGPFLAGVKPSYSLQGKAVRYDCIVPVQIGASLPPDGA